jgi:hypothetical protein
MGDKLIEVFIIKGLTCSLNVYEDVGLFRAGLGDMPLWVKYLHEVGLMSRPPWWHEKAYNQHGELRFGLIGSWACEFGPKGKWGSPLGMLA